MSSYDAHRSPAMTAERKAEQRCDGRNHYVVNGVPCCTPLPTESEPEREKCHQFYCPNHPAWIPAGQNGCPHCAGTATRGFCICETASVDEIREMYTPPAPKTPSPEVGIAILAAAKEQSK